jgi:phasin family protein
MAAPNKTPDKTPDSGGTSPQAILTEMTKRFYDMRFPTMVPDTSALMAAYKRNMDALAAANKLAIEGAHTVARRNMEIMQAAMTDLTGHLRELAVTASPREKAARQAELIKQSYEHAVANIHEMSDLIHKSSEESLHVLGERFREALDEIKGLMDKAEKDESGK